jgi:acyl-CoA reductase-like NAD-dependent aldehyde dehydrogenase
VIVQEEVFGPVLPLQVFDTEAQAVALANDSEYGLAASVWSRDADRPLRVARSIQAGMVWINDWMYCARVRQPISARKRRENSSFDSSNQMIRESLLILSRRFLQRIPLLAKVTGLRLGGNRNRISI